MKTRIKFYLCVAMIAGPVLYSAAGRLHVTNPLTAILDKAVETAAGR